MRVTETIEIARAPEEIWPFIADHINDPAWCEKVKSAEVVGSGQWRLVHRPIPLRPALALILEHLELDPPRRLKLREEDDLSLFEVEYQLEATSTGTRFQQSSDFEWKRVPRLLSRPLARGVKLDVRRQLRALKRILEAAPSGSGA